MLYKDLNPDTYQYYASYDTGFVFKSCAKAISDQNG